MQSSIGCILWCNRCAVFLKINCYRQYLFGLPVNVKYHELTPVFISCQEITLNHAQTGNLELNHRL